MFDFDKDGIISKEDFQNAMSTYGNALSEEQLDDIGKLAGN